jgi:hypothetical protein
MKYIYNKLEEPQKNLLLSLVRMGFSLSDDIIICLSEKQKNEFDFQAISILNSGDIFRATEGEIKSTNESDDYFKLGEDLEIKNELNFDGKIKDFKLNDSSLIFYISKEEFEENEKSGEIQNNQLKIELENIIVDPNFEFIGINLYNFFIKFNCLKNLLQEEEYSKIKLYEQKIQQIQEISNNLKKYIDKIESKECEFCKTNYSNLFAFLNDNYDFHIAHEKCI